MASDNWRSKLGAVERYANIEKMKKSIESRGLSSTGTAMKTAIAAETDAFNTSSSRDIYDQACSTIISPSPPDRDLDILSQPTSTGITIGPYLNCHHIASGLTSEVYRTQVLALKIITETRDMEPHNPQREIKILTQLRHPSIIKLESTTKDADGRLVLVFPYMPLTLAKLIGEGAMPAPPATTKSIFRQTFEALAYLHAQDIIHRDIKPSNILLSLGPSTKATGAAGAADYHVQLADFGTAWHPELSKHDEPRAHKVLEVGTTCYRAPETLFGNRGYGSSLDLWATGTMLAECVRDPPTPLFESRGGDEDGNQLGLILSMFKTLGTPTRETWPEAQAFTTPPFEWYQEFPARRWEDLLPAARVEERALVAGLVCFESGRRLTAQQALEHAFFQ